MGNLCPVDVIVCDLSDFFTLLADCDKSETQRWLSGSKNPFKNEINKITEEIEPFLDELSDDNSNDLFRRDDVQSRVMALQGHTAFLKYLNKNKEKLIQCGKAWVQHKLKSDEKISLSKILVTLKPFITEMQKNPYRIEKWITADKIKSHHELLDGLDKAFLSEIDYHTLTPDELDKAMILQSREWNQAIADEDRETLHNMIKARPAVKSYVTKHIEKFKQMSDDWLAYQKRSGLEATKPNPSPFISKKEALADFNKIIQLTYDLRNQYHKQYAHLMYLYQDYPKLFHVFKRLASENAPDEIRKSAKMTRCHFLGGKPEALQVTTIRFNSHIESLEHLIIKLHSLDLPKISQAFHIDKSIDNYYFHELSIELKKRCLQKNSTRQDKPQFSTYDLCKQYPLNLFIEAYKNYDIIDSSSNQNRHLPVKIRIRQDCLALDSLLVIYKDMDDKTLCDQIFNRYAYHPILVMMDLYEKQSHRLQLFEVSRRFADHARFLSTQMPEFSKAYLHKVMQRQRQDAKRERKADSKILDLTEAETMRQEIIAPTNN